MRYDPSLAGKKVGEAGNIKSNHTVRYDASLAGQSVGVAGYNTDYLQETLTNASKVLEGMSGIEDAEKGRSAAVKALGALQRYRKVVSAQRDNYTNADELLKEIDNSISIYEKTCKDLSPESIKRHNLLASVENSPYSIKKEIEKWAGIDRAAYNSALEKLRKSGNGEPVLTPNEKLAVETATKKGIFDYRIEANLYKAQKEAKNYNPKFWEKLAGEDKFNPVSVNLKNAEKGYELLQEEKYIPNVNEISDTVKQQALLMPRDELKKAAEQKDFEKKKLHFNISPNAETATTVAKNQRDYFKSVYYLRLAENEDFEEMSAFDSGKHKVSALQKDTKNRLLVTGEKEEDLKYSSQVDGTDMDKYEAIYRTVNNQVVLVDRDVEGTVVQMPSYREYSYLSDDEKKIYTYLYNKGDTKALKEYLEFLKPRLNSYKTYAMNKEMEYIAESGGVIANTALAIGSVPANLVGGVLGTLDNTLRWVTGEDLDTNSAMHILSNASSAITSAQSAVLEKKYGEAASFLYETGNSILNSVAAVYTFGPGATYVLGASAAESETKRLLANGASDTQAFFGGMAAGAIEMATERFSVENLLKSTNPTSVINIFKSALKQSGVEMSEEIAAEVLGKISNSIIMGEYSDHNMRIKELMKSGLSYELALKKKMCEDAADIGRAAASGFLSGFVSSGAFSTVGYIKNSNSDISLSGQELLDIGKNVLNVDNNVAVQSVLNYANNSEDQRLQEVAKTVKFSSDAPIDALSVGRLYNAVGENIRTKMAESKNLSELTAVLDDVTNNIKSDAMAMTAALYYSANVNRIDASLYALENSENEVQNGEAQEENTLPTKSGSAFDEVSVAKKEDNFYADALALIDGQENLTKEQAFVKGIAKSLGIPLKFGKVFLPDGKTRTDGITFDDGRMVIDYDCEEPLKYVFEHEVTHFGQRSRFYPAYRDAALDSKAFAKWISNVEIFGEKIEGETIEEKIKDYKKKVKEAYAKAWKGLNDAQKELKAEREMIARFSGEVLFSGDMTMLTNMLGAKEAKQRNAIIDFFADLFRYLKEKLKGNQKITLEIVKLERLFNEAVYDAAQSLKNETETSENQKTTTEKISGSGDYLIVALENGNVYVKASRKVISGDSISDWRRQITNFFNVLLQGQPNIEIETIEGDVLTISKNETANKARDNYKSENGFSVRLSDEEFKVKLNIESHIDEIAETSKETSKSNDKKNHDFAKDGFTYRTAYFEDFDGQYYKVTLSVGKNKNIATVYNVGKIKKEIPSSAKIIAVVGSQALNGISSDNSIPLSGETVNNNLSGEGGDYSINLNKTRDDAIDLLEGKISLDEYVEKQEKANKARESRIRRAVKSERDKFKGFSGSIIDLERGVKEILGIADSTYDKESLKNEIGALLSLSDRKNINQDTVAIIRASCEQIAQEVVAQSKDWHIRAEDSQEMLDEIHGTKIYLSEHQKSEIEFVYGSVKNYQNMLRGRVVFTNDSNSGTALETAFSEWAEMRPDLFNTEVTETDLPQRFAEIVETLTNDYVEYDPQNAIRNTTDALLTMCMNVRRENLKAYTKAQLKSTGELIRTEEQARLEAAADRRRKLNNIQRITNKLARRLINGTDTSHIPDNLGKAITDFLNVFNENSSVVFDKKILQFLTGELNAFKRMRERNFESTDFYDEDVINSIAELEDILTSDIIQNLDNETLGVIEDICNYFDFLVNDQEEQFLNGKKRKAKEVGNGALRDLEQEHSRLTKAPGNDKTATARGFIITNNLPPYYVFKRLGPTFEKLYNDMVEGSDRMTKHLENAANFFEELYKKYNYKKWKKDTVSFKTKYGVEIEITVEQALQLWVTGNRERSINPKQTQHIFSGGVSFDLDTVKKAKGFLSAIKGKKADKVEALRKELRTGSRTTALRIGFEDIDTIETMLSKEQLAYASEIVNFLSNECGAWGNEVSLQMYGYKKYTEKNYIPYITLESFLKTEGGQQVPTQSVRKPGFTHTLQRFAKTPLLIEGLTETAAAHIEKMAGYNALAVPLNTFNSILNYTEKKISARFNGEEEIIPIPYDSTYEETLKKHFNRTDKELRNEGYELDIIAGKSVKETLEHSFGKDAREYIDKFFEDLNGGIRRDSAEGFLGWAAGNVKKSAVLMSMSVVVQQPTAIIRACKYIDSKYFAMAAKYHASWDEIKFNAPVAALKEKGRYNVGMGVSNRNWILGSEGENFGDKVDNVTGYLAGKADCVTWQLLYKAVMAEIADTTKLEVGSIEFNEAVSKRFTEIIYKTQVFDSTLTKSANLRSNSLTMKNITSFMAEPTLSMAMLYDGALDLAEKKITVKAFGRTVASVMLSGIFAAAFKSLVAAARDDDEDRTYWERFIQKFAANLFDEIILVNKIPWVRDIVSLSSGYEVERYDLAAITDIVTAYQKLVKDDFSKESLYKLTAAVATFFGIPVQNLNRDIEAIFNIANDIKEAAGDGREFSWNEAKYAALEGVGAKDGVEANYERLAEALTDGDQKEYDSVYKHLETKGKSESEIHSGIVKALKKDDDVKKEFEKITDGIEKNKTYKELSDKDKKEAENKILTALAKEAKAEAEEPRSAVYDRMYEYKRLGKKKALQEEKDKLIKKGVSEYEIENGIEVAKYAYLKSSGVDLKAYALFMMAKKEDYADLDGSGGVSKAEKFKALEKLDADKDTKNAIKKAITQGIF